MKNRTGEAGHILLFEDKKQKTLKKNPPKPGKREIAG